MADVSPSAKVIRAWCFYDWANSAFATSIMAAVLPLFFRQIAAVDGSGVAHPLAMSLWGYTSAAAMLLVAVLSLILGPLADHRAAKKRYLAVFMAVGSLSTSLLGFCGLGDWPWVSLLFMLGSIGFAGSEVFYDALLPHIAPLGRMDQVSTRAYALGYIGGGILLLVNLAMILKLPGTALPNGETAPLMGMRLTFVSVGVWWFGFTLPLLRTVPEPGLPNRTVSGPGLAIALSRLRDTFGDLRRYRPSFSSSWPSGSTTTASPPSSRWPRFTATISASAPWTWWALWW